MITVVVSVAERTLDDGLEVREPPPPLLVTGRLLNWDETELDELETVTTTVVSIVVVISVVVSTEFEELLESSWLELSDWEMTGVDEELVSEPPGLDAVELGTD